ncbi:hypothetical protein MalM25_01780 [Planctomycetes bacterium MalM25]|nr:hypothetical protein MalM25_01780 [Planctomycetes bacterium MalM25]
MAVDPYAPCPCGSGKKLKFCCSDLVHEIEKVQRMLEGDQPRAALAHLEKTLAKAPGRASLLDLKATLELSLGDLEAARATVEEYLKVDPQNASAHAQAALLAAGDEPGDQPLADDGPARRSVGHLQDALELVTDSIPARVLQAIGAVGQALLAAGGLMGARAHLWLYQGVAGDEDTRAMELLMRLNQVGGLPLLLRDNQFLREAPIGHDCEAQHDHAQLLASRGQWRRAAQALDKLCGEHPGLAILHHNAALVHGWLGDQQRLVAGLRKYAELTAAASDGLPDDAIEAEAIAQLIDDQHREDAIEVVRTTFPVSDEEALIDRLTRDQRVAPHRLSEADLQALDGPPPRHTLLVLDKPLPETGVGVTVDAAPRIAGILSYFGRQTDRPERLELIADRDEAFDATLALVAEIAGETLGAAGENEKVGQSAAGEIGLRSRWRFPDDTPVADRRRVIAAEQRRVLSEEWPAKTMKKLADKSPADAAQDDSLALPLAAALLVLEQTNGAGSDPQIFTELRERLGTPPAAAIDPAKIEVEVLPMTRVARVDLGAASDEAILTLYKRAELAGATDAALVVAREAARRDGLTDVLPPEELYSRLAALEPDVGQALGWIEQGRQATDGSNANWDLAELELRVMEGQFDEANQLVHHLRDEHLNEPGVAEKLYQVLYALGAVPGPGEASAGPAEPLPPAETPPAGDSKLWTPGDDAPASGGDQKIWTPG